ncbi:MULTISPECIES: response regulator [Clostridium]|uniref:Stage 0 sporulation protein A homolog n=2 Tax=Clostridium TaxID=1485 RepID=A0A0E3M632_CLOSL|nr:MULTISPECIES: response regulator [Clostridium]AKA68884.1 response regulator receiver protein [Clostridium scatologenes]AWI04906.1 response regulator [Clostridium drakei]
MKKVLIVDNSSYMRMFVKKIIEKGGFLNTFEASGREEAIEIFKAEKPDIVLLDLNMSEFRMDGMHVLSDIIKIDPEAVVIIMSAVGHEEVKDECIEAGAKGYIKKPFTTESLLKALEEYK